MSAGIRFLKFGALAALAVAAAFLPGCSGPSKVSASQTAPVEATPVGVTAVVRKPIERQLTVSSELVPFQEIDIYAKEAGFIKELKVDYGTHVQTGELMAVLEIPELEVQLSRTMRPSRTSRTW